MGAITIERQQERRDFFFKASFYVWCFFVCSFVGWIYECIWKSILNEAFTNPGFLKGFYLPIYGFGGLILIFSLKSLLTKTMKVGRLNVRPIVVFLLIMLIVSVVEYIASVVLELIYDKRWWDYSNADKLHINGRVSLRNSSILASLGFVFVYIVFPFLKKMCRKIHPTVMKIVAVIIAVIMGIDFIISC